MLVKIVKGPLNEALVLCNEDNGEPLPNQVSTKLECDCDGYATLTVKFRVDGDKIKLIPSFVLG